MESDNIENKYSPIEERLIEIISNSQKKLGNGKEGRMVQQSHVESFQSFVDSTLLRSKINVRHNVQSPSPYPPIRIDQFQCLSRSQTPQQTKSIVKMTLILNECPLSRKKNHDLAPDFHVGF